MNVGHPDALIFFDIDGTICRYEGSPHTTSIEAFRRLHELNMVAFLCTGRGEVDVPREILDLGFEGIISSMGADIRINGELLQHEFISQVMLEETTSVLLDNQIAAIFTGKDRVFRTEFMSPVLMESGVIRRVEDLYQDSEFPHISSLDIEYPCFRKLEPCLPAIWKHSEFVEYNANEGQTQLIGINKSKAIRRVLSIPRYQGMRTYGIGDSQNDLEMLVTVDVGIAMGDAPEEVLRIADYITDTLENDGLYNALSHFALI